MIRTIPYGKQNISDEDIKAVVNVLNSDYLTQGPKVPLFEEAIKTFCKTEYAIAVNSATSALHIACLALDVGKGDIVWTSPISFVASANCALYCHANIDFVDIDPETYLLSPEKLEEKLICAEKIGKLPKVVIPVHLAGQSCEMEKIFNLSLKFGFKIIEDASHAIGGKYQKEPIGNNRYSDIVIFSFHPVKIITTGEGGMITTKNKKLAKRLQLLRSHGTTNIKSEMKSQESTEIWNYEQIDLGFNFRMTDISAALGISQMKRVEEFVLTRHNIADRYNKLLSDLPLKVPLQNLNSYSSYHLYIIRLKLKNIKKTHIQIFNEMRAQGVQVNLHYIPIYRHPYFERMGFNYGYCEEAEKYFMEAISLPIFFDFSIEEQLHVSELLHSTLLN
jgi:UDP-4-amino-4,6-dideoxy-N-acetyl-beta-L-altrosamine transaminase